MNSYTIFCTEEQTKKACNLNAPLEIGEGKGTVLCRYRNFHTYKRCVKPTAEQMKGWLRSKGLRFRIKDLEESTYWEVSLDGWFAYGELSTPNEATLAAIDSALDYLIKKKK